VVDATWLVGAVLGTSLGAEEVVPPVPLPVHPAIESTAANRVSERRTWRRIWARVFRRSTNTPLIGDQSVTWFTGEAKQEDLEFLAGLSTPARWCLSSRTVTR
jgi:hypothetical protein